jgi:hypothetical protein
LIVQSALDERTYVKGRKVKKSEMAALDITGDAFHPEWNYTIKPRRTSNL